MVNLHKFFTPDSVSVRAFLTVKLWAQNIELFRNNI